MIDIQYMKAIFFTIMFAVTMVCGLLPVKILHYLRSNTNSIETFASVISILSCFSGGVFLGVCLLDMLPDALESFEEFKEHANFKYDLPVVPIIIGVGFFFIYIFDQVTATCCGGHAHSHDVASNLMPTHSLPRMETDEMVKRRSIPSISSADTLDLSSRNGRNAYLKSLTFIVAFLLHVSLEGFALGVQKDSLSGLSLFIGIVLHKGIAAFSIGTRLYQNHPRNSAFVVAMLVLVATVTTLGGVLGMVLEETAMEPASKAAIETILTGISIGTFLYITFFEILGSEKGTLAQRLAALVGFVVIGATVIIVH